jgi:hypothetical protein
MLLMLLALLLAITPSLIATEPAPPPALSVAVVSDHQGPYHRGETLVFIVEEPLPATLLFVNAGFTVPVEEAGGNSWRSTVHVTPLGPHFAVEARDAAGGVDRWEQGEQVYMPRVER